MKALSGYFFMGIWVGILLWLVWFSVGKIDPNAPQPPLIEAASASSIPTVTPTPTIFVPDTTDTTGYQDSTDDSTDTSTDDSTDYTPDDSTDYTAPDYTAPAYSPPVYYQPPPPVYFQPPVMQPLPGAYCEDGSPSYSMTRSGTCSHHGGVYSWN